MIELIMLWAITSSPTHPPYTCVTDYECQVQCERYHEKHCDNPFYKEN